MNAAPDGSRGIRTEPLSELKDSDPVQRSASDQPPGRVKLEVCIEQRREGGGGSIDGSQ